MYCIDSWWNNLNVCVHHEWFWLPNFIGKTHKSRSLYIVSLFCHLNIFIYSQFLLYLSANCYSIAPILKNIEVIRMDVCFCFRVKFYDLSTIALRLNSRRLKASDAKWAKSSLSTALVEWRIWGSVEVTSLARAWNSCLS